MGFTGLAVGWRCLLASILIIDDSPTHRREILSAIEPAEIFDRIVVAEDGLQGLKRLITDEVDLVLCDLELPGLDGEKLLRVKEATPRSANIPFLFVTASQDLDRRARLLESGACDVVSKPFHPADLLARLRLHLKVKRLQDELRLKNETFARLSITDSLTGLRSRRYACESLAIEVLRARRYGSQLSVLMADLDHFKRINDEFGHPAGDAALRGVSGLLIDQLRATDTAGRYGGEEILVILSQSDLKGARALAERWRASVEETEFEASDGRCFSVRISVGLASYDSEMNSADALVGAADAALYRAKALGRNRVEV